MFFGGTGVTSGRNSQTVEMQAGSAFTIPAGTYALAPGGGYGTYTTYEVFDSQTNIWRVAGSAGTDAKWVNSDGINHRLANRSGCAVAANVTSGGAGYTSAPTVTINSGGSKWIAVMGPVVSAASVVNGGTNYIYPPTVYINPPPDGGVPATGYATISAGVVSTVTITDEGAGYLAGSPLITLVNDPRDTTGNGATATATLAGSGTVAAILCTDFGTPTGISTSGTLPTFTMAGGGYTTIATAVPEMAWSATGYTLTSAGSGYQSAVINAYAVVSGTSAYTNPTIQSKAVRARSCVISGNVSAGALTTGGTIYDGGIFPQNPTVVVVGATSGGATSVAIPVLTMGGINDAVLMMPV